MAAADPLLSEPLDVLQSPSASSGPFVGIRVVELATVVAVPSCAQWFSMLGADVIKIESPAGDAWRQFGMTLLSAERQKMKTSPVFDMVNRGKRSLILDLKKNGKEEMLRLLKDADVFVTNYTPKQLEKHNLPIHELRSKFPSLVIGSLTGWGSTGPMSTVPGYDAMCFFAATGMASQLCPELKGCQMCYPLAFGDLATGLVLTTAVVLGLVCRSKAGDGTAVETSLFEAGMWAMQPQINGCAPDASASNRLYKGKDGEWVAVCHEFDDTAVKKIATAVDASASSVSAIESACSNFEGMELIERFTKQGLKSMRCAGLYELAESNATPDLQANSGRLTDLLYAPGLPCSFTKSIPPETKCFPLLGDCKRSEQTGSYWKPRDAAAASPGASFSEITILEYSDSSSSAVAGACALFARLGARVIRIDTPLSRRLAQATGESTWHEHLHNKKTTVTSFEPYLSSAQMLVTDVAESKRPFQFPPGSSVVYFDPGNGTLAGFFANYIALYCRGCSFEKPLKQPPFQVIDMLVSYAIAASMATSLFHLQRFGARAGQITTVDMTKACLYLEMMPLTLGQAVPNILKLQNPASRIYSNASEIACCKRRKDQGSQPTKEYQQLMSPVPVAQVVQTKDGRWLMVSSPNLPEVTHLLTTLGIKGQVLWTAITQKVPLVVYKKLSGEKDKLEVAGPLFSCVNAEIIQALSSMTSQEWEENAKTHGWAKYTYLALNPKELCQHEQCKALGSLQPVVNGMIVKVPLQGLTL